MAGKASTDRKAGWDHTTVFLEIKKATSDQKWGFLSFLTEETRLKAPISPTDNFTTAQHSQAQSPGFMQRFESSPSFESSQQIRKWIYVRRLQPGN